MACCGYCYEKYIEEDTKEIDTVKVAELEAAQLKNLEAYYKKHPERLKAGKLIKAEPCTCRCVCHVKGSMVMH